MASLHESSRAGDLEKVKFLVEVDQLDPNLLDAWCGCPLYYACLCGHLEVVRYLLQSGARFDEQTFQGERCYYGKMTHLILKFPHNLMHNTRHSLSLIPCPPQPHSTRT
jgi:ankyrin repeat/BTB/POZ domain-containing protein 1